MIIFLLAIAQEKLTLTLKFFKVFVGSDTGELKLQCTLMLEFTAGSLFH